MEGNRTAEGEGCVQLTVSSYSGVTDDLPPWLQPSLHDWRLVSLVLERERTDSGQYAASRRDWIETWYCTRCRIIERRRAEG